MLDKRSRKSPEKWIKQTSKNSSLLLKSEDREQEKTACHIVVRCCSKLVLDMEELLLSPGSDKDGLGEDCQCGYRYSDRYI